MELILGLIVIGLVLYGLAKLTEFFEDRKFLLWLICYLAGGGLLIILFAASKAAK